MKFRGIKPIVGDANAWREISESLRDLFTGMTKLSFVDNMESFEASNITIGAGLTVTIKNQLKNIPIKWVVVGNSAGMGISDNGRVGWSAEQVTIKNVGASSTIISVIFFR